MGQINPTVPSIGQDNVTEDVDIVNCFNAIINCLNGNIDEDNMSPTAEIPYTSLDLSNSITPTDLAASVGIVPTGVISQYIDAVAPTGWLLCDGTAVSRATYAALFALVGTDYGVGNGSTTFNIPNLKGKVAVGVDAAQTEFDVLGESGGVKTVALSTAELASHAHNPGTLTTDTEPVHSHGLYLSTDTQAAHTHGRTNLGVKWTGASNTETTSTNPSTRAVELGAGGYESPLTGSIDSGGAHSHLVAGSTLDGGTHDHLVTSGATATNGSGTAHNNLQPYLTVHYIIKT